MTEVQKEAPKSDKVYRYEGREPGDWEEFLALWHANARVEIDQTMFDYWLEVLPPAFMRRKVKLVDGTEKFCAFGFVEGADRITGFWKEDGRYFCQFTTLISRGG